MTKRATRRTFLKLSAAAASISAAEFAHAAPGSPVVFIRVVPGSPLIAAESVQWALGRLREALAGQGVPESHENATHFIQVAAASAPTGRYLAGQFDITPPESFAILTDTTDAKPSLLVIGHDARGLVYGLLELADRIRLSDDPVSALHLPAPIIETTPNKVRSVSRGFCSEIEDKAWFYDRAFWTRYLDTLATARFNRFAFTLGLAYDFPRGVTGDYLHFPYPYLVEVPGYEQVHVEPALQPGERQRNLETLQFIAAETARRGMEFQLGIWTHAYEWTDSPHSDHHIAGLTPETHAPYCRDALAAILAACPQITGLTMRIHGESGIPEGSYDFWQTLFDAIPAARTPDGKPRVIEIDMHAKGLNQIMIDMARKTGMPVKAGAKFWAEHLGLGYQQTDIRANEYPKAGVTGTFAVSAGERNFTRYGYGDFYQFPQGAEPGKSIDLLYRVWPGTQRHLLWADPALASGYGRAANFCGAAGLELMEPLFFKGREGSGQPGGRDAYADASLASGPVVPPLLSSRSEAEGSVSRLSDLDTAKFALTYLLWGRYLYNPDTAPDFYHRTLKQAFGPAGPALETALAASSRILPLITTAWCPSASNHEFWPEMLTHCSILPYTGRPLYTDNPAPHNVSAISPLDPQLFTSIGQHAENLVSGKPDARYNTSEVIAWLESMVATSTKALAAAHAATDPKHLTPEFRRAEEDILILNGLGTYYANLFRAALLSSIYGQNGYAPECLLVYQKARDAWGAMAERADKVYASDISYGSTAWRRGHWSDRLAAIEADIEAMHKHLGVGIEGPYVVDHLVVPPPPARPTIAAHHNVPETFHAGSDLWLTIATPRPLHTEPILWYRHVNQGERWLSITMDAHPGTYSAAIPAAYTASPYPLQYYFELRTATAATLHPPFNPTLSNQPYFAIHKRT
jgi:hypothetical protein